MKLTEADETDIRRRVKVIKEGRADRYTMLRMIEALIKFARTDEKRERLTEIQRRVREATSKEGAK